MTKGIKVWVAVTPIGNLTEHISLVNEVAALCFAAQYERRPITANIESEMKALGWTVEPYTLTRGHGDD